MTSPQSHTEQAEQLIAAVNDAMHHPYDNRPVAQPGRPPMSQRATDTSVMMLTAGLATVPPGLITIGVMLASGYANPAVIGLICAAPAAITVPIFAVARLLKGVKEVEPAVHNHHYTGPVSQQHHTVSTETRGFIAKTINKQ